MLGSIMLSVGLIAIDATILATAVPSIVEDLGGFTQFPWLFSIFLLAQAVSVPIYAKFSDMVGRKPIMLIGIAVFVIASVLCGLAWSMPALIAFRALQGLGAGAVQPTSMTIIGDLYSVVERAKVQGYVASVWAMSSVVGPTLGGLFVDFVNWRWIFFINVPLGLLAAWMLHRHFHEEVKQTKHTIDYAGAVLLTLGSSLVIFALLEGGLLWPWLSLPSLVIIGSGVAFLAVFALVERRAAEPMLPGWIFRHRLINSTNLVSVTVGVILIGLTSYVPLYVQGVLGTGALVAGFALAGLTLGWPIAASVAGRVYLRLGFRNTALIGTIAGRRRRGDAHRRSPRPPRSGRSARPVSSSASGWGWSPARRWWRPRTRWSGRTAVSSPAPPCSPARWAAPWASRSSGRSPTPRWPVDSPPRAPPAPPTSPPQSWTTRWARSSSGSR